MNRDVTAIQGTRGVHLSQREGNGIAWIEGSEFAEGTIELEVRGRDVFQQSFVGVAFHRRGTIRIHVGSATSPALEVRKLGHTIEAWWACGWGTAATETSPTFVSRR